jgi:hypothetical protein
MKIATVLNTSAEEIRQSWITVLLFVQWLTDLAGSDILPPFLM